MITCKFENGNEALLRHTTADNIALKDGKILLVLREQEMLEGGKYSLPGGFMDRNEDSQQAAARELLEETGFKTASSVLFAVIDDPERTNKDDRQNINFLYLTQIGEQSGKPDHEIERIEWFALDQLPDETRIAFDHWKLIQLYLKHRNSKLPILVHEWSQVL